MYTKVQEQKILIRMSTPKTNEQPKGNPFGVTKNYFMVHLYMRAFVLSYVFRHLLIHV